MYTSPMRALLVFLTALAAGTSSLQDPVRTADISLRGLTKADFPRVTKLADNVYAYEQIDPTKRTVTVNNLIVITSAGVLVAESQGTIDNVKRLVADVAKLTPQPIKYAVDTRCASAPQSRGRPGPRPNDDGTDVVVARTLQAGRESLAL